MSVEVAYQQWLTEKLQNFEIDHEIFGTYIISIIASDESQVEKSESLRDILLSCTGDVDIDTLCDEILEKWAELHDKSSNSEKDEKEKVDVIAHRVALIMEKQAQPVLKVANRSSEEKKLREAILSSCRFVSSDEDGDESDGAGAPVSSTSHNTCQNQNIDAVVQAEKEKRDKLKSESEKKKAQCKDSREKQKQKQEERKEKERKRTQKREHKR